MSYCLPVFRGVKQLLLCCCHYVSIIYSLKLYCFRLVPLIYDVMMWALNMQDWLYFFWAYWASWVWAGHEDTDTWHEDTNLCRTCDILTRSLVLRVLKVNIEKKDNHISYVRTFATCVTNKWYLFLYLLPCVDAPLLVAFQHFTPDWSFVSMWPTNFHNYQSGSRLQPPALWTCRWSRQVSQSNFNLFIECLGGMVLHYLLCNRVTALQASRSAAAREIPWQPE